MSTARRAKFRNVLTLALLGAVSGGLSAAIIDALPDDLGPNLMGWLMLSPGSLAPGVMFGLIVGLAPQLRELAGLGVLAVYLAASTLSYLAAYTLAVNTVEFWNSFWITGVVAGLFGGACLTAAAAVLFPFARQARPIGLMLLAACLLGAVLEVPLDVITRKSEFWRWVVFFAAWQAGYAAAFATALPERAGSEQRGSV
jgi:hypothetical protein